MGLTCSAAGTKLKMQLIFRRKTVPDELNERPDDDIDAWVAENGNTTDETMADLVESVLVPHLKKHGGGPGRGKLRALFIVDGAGSHKGPLFKAACARNNIDLAVIPASCTDEIQLIDVAVNKPFKDMMYYCWAMWMKDGPQKVQPKSGNRVAANFTDILTWCAKAWDSVARETILSCIGRCYMNSEPGELFIVEEKSSEVEESPDPERKKKEPKKVKVVKSKTPDEMERLQKKKERKKKREEAARRKAEREAKEKENGKLKSPKRKAAAKKKKKSLSSKKKNQKKKVARKKKKK